MREALKNAVHNAILLECKLPHQESGLDKSCLSSQNDICFSNSNPQEISKIIYNGIVYFLRTCSVATVLFNKEKFITARRNTRSRNKSPENWMFLIENTGKTCGKG